MVKILLLQQCYNLFNSQIERDRLVFNDIEDQIIEMLITTLDKLRN